MLHFPEEHVHTSRQTYRSKYHVQGHGDVEIQGVVVDHADGEEHGHHYGVVPERQRRQLITQDPRFQENQVEKEIHIFGLKSLVLISSGLKDRITITM